MADLSGYRSDMQYLREKSANGTLLRSNAIYQKLDQKSKNIRELRSFLTSLNVK